MAPKIAVLGTGANGASIGADLTRAGHDVTFIEQWPAHVEAMREQGITVRFLEGETTNTKVNVYHVCQVAELREQFDIVYVVLKAYDTRWGVELIKPLVKDDGVVIGLQNGMSMQDILDIMGPKRTLGGVIELGSNMFTPGEVERHNGYHNSWFALGAYNEVAHAKAEQAAEILRASGTVEVVDDINSSKWMKLVLNAAELVPSAILNLSIFDAAHTEGFYELMVAAGDEAVQAGIQRGHKIVPIFGLTEVNPDTFARDILDLLLNEFSFPSTKATVLQDWMKGRRSEVREINGLVVDALGTEQAPVNAACVQMALEIERGEREAGLHNLAELLERAGFGK